MAKSKDDIKYGAAEGKEPEDGELRVAYKAGTPLEAGIIAADIQPVGLFSGAHNIEKQQQRESGNKVIAESEPVSFYSGAHNIAKQQQQQQESSDNPK